MYHLVSIKCGLKINFLQNSEGLKPYVPRDLAVDISNAFLTPRSLYVTASCCLFTPRILVPSVLYCYDNVPQMCVFVRGRHFLGPINLKIYFFHLRKLFLVIIFLIISSFLSSLFYLSETPIGQTLGVLD